MKSVRKQIDLETGDSHYNKVDASIELIIESRLYDEVVVEVMPLERFNVRDLIEAQVGDI